MPLSTNPFHIFTNLVESIPYYLKVEGALGIIFPPSYFFNIPPFLAILAKILFNVTPEASLKSSVPVAK
jgi:hypothetical protein